jgi:hypothetical protein
LSIIKGDAVLESLCKLFSRLSDETAGDTELSDIVIQALLAISQYTMNSGYVAALHGALMRFDVVAAIVALEESDDPDISARGTCVRGFYDHLLGGGEWRSSGFE